MKPCRCTTAKEIRLGRYSLIEGWDGHVELFDNVTSTGISLPPVRMKRLERILEKFIENSEVCHL